VSLLSHVATVARRLRIDVHDNDDNNDNAWQRGPLWPHRMGPITILFIAGCSCDAFHAGCTRSEFGELATQGNAADAREQNFRTGNRGWGAEQGNQIAQTQYHMPAYGWLIDWFICYGLTTLSSQNGYFIGRSFQPVCRLMRFSLFLLPREAFAKRSIDYCASAILSVVTWSHRQHAVCRCGPLLCYITWRQ